MATVATNPKQQAHELIDRISTAQASAVVTLITTMLDPVDRAIANAPFGTNRSATKRTAPWPLPRPGSG